MLQAQRESAAGEGHGMLKDADSDTPRPVGQAAETSPDGAFCKGAPPLLCSYLLEGSPPNAQLSPPSTMACGNASNNKNERFGRQPGHRPLGKRPSSADPTVDAGQARLPNARLVQRAVGPPTSGNSSGSGAWHQHWL